GGGGGGGGRDGVVGDPWGGWHQLELRRALDDAQLFGELGGVLEDRAGKGIAEREIDGCREDRKPRDTHSRPAAGISRYQLAGRCAQVLRQSEVVGEGLVGRPVEVPRGIRDQRRRPA